MPSLKINKRLEKLFYAKQQIIVLIGGRGSGKSIGVGDYLAFKMATEGADIYCLREFQDSVSDSVHRVFADSIQKRLCLDGWDVQENKIVGPQGQRTVYKGANRNPDSMQSAQGYKYSWFEEAHRASQSSIDKLLPTILRNPGAKCIFTANPQSSADPFSKRFITPYLKQLERDGIYEDDLHLVMVVNWRDNPWWNEEQERLRLWDYENLPRSKYGWIWEGKFNDHVDNSIIKSDWFDACIDAHKLDRLKDSFTPHGAVIAAHDPFDDGKDAGGFAVRHGSIIRAVKSKDKGEIDECFDWAAAEAKIAKADWFVWDGDGMGTGLKRQASLAFDGTRTAYQMFKGGLSGKAQDNADKIYQKEFGGKETNPKTYSETFKNNRAQYYTMLADRVFNTYKAVTRGEYINPDEMISFDSDGIEDLNTLRSQLCRIPRIENPNGLIQLMSKKGMKDKLELDSPNEADAVMMTMFIPPIKAKKKRKALNYGKSALC